MPTQLLTTTQMAEILQIHPKTLRGWVTAGQVRSYRIGQGHRGHRFLMNEVLEDLRMHKDTVSVPRDECPFPTPSNSVLPMYISDGSSIVVGSIAGGACSTDGIPDFLVLVLIDPDGNERHVKYSSAPVLMALCAWVDDIMSGGTDTWLKGIDADAADKWNHHIRVATSLGFGEPT